MSDILNANEKHTLIARKLLAHVDDELAKRRLENDHIALDDTKTAQLRGRIAELKAFKALLEDPAAP
jgi:hypothetical protein